MLFFGMFRKNVGKGGDTVRTVRKKISPVCIFRVQAGDVLLFGKLRNKLCIADSECKLKLVFEVGFLKHVCHMEFDCCDLNAHFFGYTAV